MAGNTTNNAWMRAQVQKLRSETNYTPMDNLVEKQQQCTTSEVYRPELTLEQYETMCQNKKRSVPSAEHKKDTNANIRTSFKRDAQDFLDIEQRYTVSNKKSHHV